MTIQNYPVLNLPLLAISGMIVSNDATTPNTKVNISAGMARDSNNVIDLALGSANPNLEGEVVAAPLVVDSGVVGANGIDTGVLQASKVYAVYVIGDSRYYNPVAGLLSLSLSAPQMPFGYDSYRLVGFAVTDGSTHFLKMYVYGQGNWRMLSFDAPQLAINAGAQTGYTGVALTAFVPAINNLPVSLFSNFNANAAADILNYQGYNSTGDAVTVIAPVAGAAAHTTSNDVVLAQLNSSAPSIKYKVSAGAVSAYVAGFSFSI